MGLGFIVINITRSEGAKSATTIKSQVRYKNFEDISDNAGIWRVKALNAPLELPIYAH